MDWKAAILFVFVWISGNSESASGLFVGHVGQVVVAAENLSDAPPERVLVQRPLDIARRVPVRRVEAADEWGEPPPHARLGEILTSRPGGVKSAGLFPEAERAPDLP